MSDVTKDFRATVVAIAIDTAVKRKSGGTYKGALLTYRLASGDIKEKGITEQTYNKYNTQLKADLLALTPGDNIVLTMTKKGDFWNVDRVQKAEDVQQEQGPSSSQERKPAYVAGRRDDVQEMILRQNAASTAARLAVADYEFTSVAQRKGIDLAALTIDYAEKILEYTSGKFHAKAEAEARAELENDSSEPEEDVPF